MNQVQGAENAAASSPAVEKKVDSGSTTEKVIDTRTAIEDAKNRLLGKSKAETPEQSKVDEQGTGTVAETQPVQAKKDKPQDDLGRLQHAFDKKKQDINKLLSQKHSLQEENAKLMAEIEKFRAKQANEPKRDDFSDDNAYNRAKIRYDIDMENGAERIQNADNALKDQRHTEWTDRCRATVKDYDRFAENYSKSYEWLTKNETELMDYASQSVVGPRLIEEAFNDLFKSDEAYAKWRGMHPQSRRNVLSQIETKMLREINQPVHQTEKQVQKSSAPAPIAPEKVSENVAPKSLSQADQLAKFRQRLLNR